MAPAYPPLLPMMMDPMYRKWLMRQRCLCGSKPTSVERVAQDMSLYVPVCRKCATDASYDRILTAASYLSAYLFGVEPKAYRVKEASQPKPEAPRPPELEEKPQKTPKTKRIEGSSPRILDEPIHTVILRWATRRIDKRPPAEWLDPRDWGDVVELARKAASEIMEVIHGKVRQTGTTL